MRFSFFISILILLVAAKSTAQVAKEVELDSVLIQAVTRGFSVEDFIDMVKTDTSFHRGFRNLRNLPHQAEGLMTIYNKKNDISATRKISARQHVVASRRWMEIVSDQVTGKYYDRHEEHEWYTAQLFDDVFFYKDTVGVADIHAPIISDNAKSKDERNIDKLKKLIFNPGSEIDGVPIIGKRMAIFDDDMTQYYDYSITYSVFADSVPCYVFSCKAKPDAGDHAVVKTLNTWFDRRTFNIVYRDYQLIYSGLLFDFNVKMKILMDYKGDTLYPSKIEYSGDWDVPFKKKENAEFVIKFSL